MVFASVLLRRRENVLQKFLGMVSILCASLSVVSGVTYCLMSSAQLKVSLLFLSPALGTLAIGIDKGLCGDVVLSVLTKYFSSDVRKEVTLDGMGYWICRCCFLLLSLLYFAGFLLVIKTLYLYLKA
jgi:hypothetical protein